MSAFTLIEFILVMALLAFVMAVAAPALANFFRGRKLESEARRFVGLARYGQSRAVSEGSPTILWIDRSAGTYGLRDQDRYSANDVPADSQRLRAGDGYEAVNAKQPQFRLAEKLRFEVEVAGRTNGRIVTIRFLPDGSIDESSLRMLQILQENQPSKRKSEPELIWIAQSRDGARYEIIDKTNAWERMSPQQAMQGRLYVR